LRSGRTGKGDMAPSPFTRQRLSGSW
jgi:hypothetical protein